MCKSLATTCTTLSGPEALSDSKTLVLQPYQQLVFSAAGARRYTNVSLSLPRATAFYSYYTALNLVDSTFLLASSHAWLAAANGTLTLDRTAARGTLRLFYASFLSFDLLFSTLTLIDTPASITSSRWTLRRAVAEFQWSAATPAPPPAYLNSFPAIITRSYVDLADSLLRFINVRDAYITYSTVTVANSQVVLVNSSLRLFDCTLDVRRAASFQLTNSTLLLGKVALRGEVVLLEASSALAGLPPAAHKSLDGKKFAVSGSGQIVLVAK